MRGPIGSGRFFCVSRIVGGIYVVDLPRADPMKLDNCFTFRPSGVLHTSGPVTEGTSRKLFRAAAIERFSGREIKDTRNHSDALSLWMRMRRDMIAVRKLKSHHERAFFGWVAFEHSHLCARRQSRWPGYPFDSRRRIESHVCRLRVFGR